MANTLEIVVKGTDRTGGAFRSVNASLSGMGSAIGHIATTAAGFLAARVLERLATQAMQLGRALSDMVVDAAPLQGIQAAFEGITGSADETLAKLREASLGMTRDRDLMLNYNLASQLVSKTFADQLPEAMKYLTKVSAATGTSMGYMMESLVRGVGRMSPLILDNLGIQASLEEATARASEMFGKEADALSKAELQAGMMNVVMEKLRINTAKMPEVTGKASQGLASLSTWFGNFKDRIGTAFLPALQNILDLFNKLAPAISDALGPAIESLGGWLDDVTRQWTHGFASLIIRAANWGANIVESLAGGIMGSDAVSRALRRVADDITFWLMPGSPPKLLPDLTEWGQGAIDAWLAGWDASQVKKSGFLRNLRANLKPFLEEIDLGQAIDPARLRATFGDDAPAVERYLAAYRDVGSAVERVTRAREGLAEAEESGDETAIASARTEYDAAQKGERDARRTFYTQERRLEKHVSAELQLVRAITERSKVETKAAEKAARLSEEAKQRAIEQAYLQYRLAVAGTAEAQIPIWEEELAKVAEGTAEFWQIKTRIVELERVMANAGAGAGGALVDGVTAGAQEATERQFNDVGAHMRASAGKIDWGGIGKAIAGAVWQGFTDWVEQNIKTQLTIISDRANEWVNDETVLGQWRGYGGSLVTTLVGGMKTKLGDADLQSGMGLSLTDFLVKAIRSVDNLLGQVMTEFAEGLIDEAVNALWRMLGEEAPPPGGALGKIGADITELFKIPVRHGIDWGAGGMPVFEWGEHGQPVEKTPTILAPSVTIAAGAIQVNLTGGNPREVGEAVEIGVLRGLRAAGVMP